MATELQGKSGMARMNRISYAEKIKTDFKWAKEWIDYIDSSYNTTNNNWYDQHERMMSNYKLYNNELDQEDLRRECDPFGFTDLKVEDVIQPYNKTYNKINILVGEESLKPLKFRCILLGVEGINSRMLEKNKMLQAFIEQKFMVLVQQEQMVLIQERMAGMNQEPASEEEQMEMQKQIEMIQAEVKERVDKLIDPDEIEAHLKTTYQDAREILANKILRYLYDTLRVKTKKREGYKHGLISNIEAIYVYQEEDRPRLKVLNPIGFIYHKSPDVQFFEDGMYAGYRQLMDIHQVLDIYGNRLKKPDIDKLVSYVGMQDNTSDDMRKMDYNHNQSLERRDLNKNRGWYIGNYGEGQYGDNSGDFIPVFHCQWRSFQKVFLLTRMNLMTMQLETMYVHEGYKIDSEAGDLSLEEEWLPEIWEGTRLGFDVYVDMRPVKHEQFNPEYPTDLKLDYMGCVYNNTNAISVSLMDRMKPFQFLYFIVMHRMKKMIAKDRGVSMSIDASMIDPSLGLERTLYYLEELDINIYNPYANGDNEMAGKVQRPALQGGIQRSTMQHVMQYINVLAALDEQIGEVAGISRQREGSTMTSESVTNVQQSIKQSSVITEIYNAIHEDIWRNVLEKKIRLAQYCYRENPLQVMHVLDDMSMELINSTEQNIADVYFGIVFSDSTREYLKFERLQQLSHALIQNDKAKLSDIVAMLHADSISELDKRIQLSETKLDKQREQEQGQQQQLQQAQFEEAAKVREEEHVREKELLNMKIEGDIKKAEIMSFMAQQNQDINNNQIPDQLEIEKVRLEKDKMRASDKVHADTMNMQGEQMRINNENERTKQDLEREKISSKERIEKEKLRSGENKSGKA